MVTTAVGLSKFVVSKRWVSARNRYRFHTREKISKEVKSGLKSPRELSQYIAASCLLHCTDGWSYLGRAISALLHGDPHRVRHLAYYAELRAAMSLLATGGIGVFDKNHFIISAPNVATPLLTKLSTHQFVWKCLEFWSLQNIAKDTFSNTIRPNGRPLEEWLNAISGKPRAASRARGWLLQWGMDLRLPSDDRDARNESSYRPDGIPQSWYVNPSATLSFAQNTWRALEPSQPSRFDIIDWHILRLILESIFDNLHGQGASQNDTKGFGRLVASVLESQNLGSEITKFRQDFLCRKTAPADIELIALARLAPEQQTNGHLAIVSRALLLLRLASGATCDLLQEVALSAESMEFWWASLGPGRGLWEGDRDSGSLYDLWADIEPILRDIDDFQERHIPNARTFFRIESELSRAVTILGTCERVALWSLIPTPTGSM